MTIDEMISKLKIECKEQKDSVAYLETQEEYAYYIEPHRQAITACEQLAEWLEELKKLREGRNEIPIATITINNEALQKMVDEKVKEIEFDIQGIRNKAIEDFTEQLKNSLIHNYKHFLTRDTDGFDWLTTDAVNTHIDEVAKQLKEGR